MIVATELSVSKYLDTADFIGAKLCRDAIWSGQRCNWFGVPVREMHRFVMLEAQSICGSHFYEGTSGIAVFLARLFAATGEKVFRTTAEGAIRQALSRLDDFPRASRINFYTGLTGVAYGLFEIAENCGIEKFNEMGLLIMEDVAADETRTLTVASSGAGTVTQLLRMHQRHQRDFLLRLATTFGEELLKQLHGYSDSSLAKNGSNDRQLSSLSVASSMLELFDVTRQERYRHAAEQILVGNREALTENAEAARVSLRAFEVLRDDVYSKWAREAIETLRSRIDSLPDENVDFSLARGLTGDGDLILEASGILADDDLRKTADRVGNCGIERYKQDDLPWPCGSATGWDAPSLMIGLAGIGYFYLRLHDNLGVPSLVFV